MQFLTYIGGVGRNGKLVAVGIGLCADPAVYIASLGAMPFELKLLAVEEGTAEKLEQLKEQFKAAHLNGPWYKPTDELQKYVDSLESVDAAVLGRAKRISLDLSPEEFAQLEGLVEEMGAKTKANLLRKAFRFYQALYRYKAQGFMIQAVKGGKMLQFPDLDTIQ